jgi:hypothetical protein
VGHPFGHAVRFCIEHLEAANDFGVRVSQEGKLDFVPLGEVLEDSLAIVANRGQLKSLRFKSLFRVLQLHELRFAEGSPVGGTEEKEDSAVRALERLVGLFMAELIGQGKCRRLPGYLEADCRSSGVIARGVFLPAWSSKYPNKKKDRDPNLHTCSKLNFRGAGSIIEARNSPASVRFSNRPKVSHFAQDLDPLFDLAAVW